MKPLFKIFSHERLKKKSDKQPQKIIVDYREKNSLVISELLSLNCKVEITNLKVADYIIGEVAIERKTISDFISSMINHRLIHQLEELQQYKNRLLLIEGIEEQELYTDSLDWKGMHPNSIRGFLISILLKYKVPIIFTKDYVDTAKFLDVLARRKSKEMSLKTGKKTLDKKEQLQFIIESFPGIGPKTAKKLLNEFKTVKNIINAEQDQLKSLIGKKSENIIRIINQKY